MHKFLLVGGATAALATTPASAGILIEMDPGFVQPEEVVLFQADNQTGTTVEGVTNQTNTGVTFTSSDNLRTTGSQGQARLEATDGALDQLTIFLTNPQLTFTEAEFNLFNAFPGTTRVTISTSAGEPETFVLNPNGQNFFGIRATDGDFLTSISFDTNGSGVSDLRQVRIGGISALQAGAVPEPGTWAMLLFGFGAIGFGMRRRKSAESGPRVRIGYS